MAKACWKHGRTWLSMWASTRKDWRGAVAVQQAAAAAAATGHVLSVQNTFDGDSGILFDVMHQAGGS